MTYDQGDVVPLGITVTDSTGVLANATSVTCTIYLPDGTSASGSVTNASTGLYNCDYTPIQVGRYQVKWTATGTNASSYADEFTVRDFTAMGIVSLDEVKTHLNIPTSNTDNDEELRRFMDVAGDMAEEYTGVILGQRNFTETFNGGDINIRVNNPYILSIASLTENGTSLTQGTDYYIDRTGQRLYRLVASSLFYGTASGVWKPGNQNIVITYRAGFVNPPPLARQGVLELIKHFWQTQRGSMNVLNLDADSYQPAIGYSMPRRVEQLLDITSLPGMA